MCKNRRRALQFFRDSMKVKTVQPNPDYGKCDHLFSEQLAIKFQIKQSILVQFYGENGFDYDSMFCFCQSLLRAS